MWLEAESTKRMWTVLYSKNKRQLQFVWNKAVMDHQMDWSKYTAIGNYENPGDPTIVASEKPNATELRTQWTKEKKQCCKLLILRNKKRVRQNSSQSCKRTKSRKHLQVLSLNTMHCVLPEKMMQLKILCKHWGEQLNPIWGCWQQKRNLRRSETWNESWRANIQNFK